MPAPLACAEAGRSPTGSATSSDTRFSNASVVEIAAQKPASPSGASSSRARDDAADDLLVVQRDADHAGRGDRDAVLAHAGSHRAAALHARGVLDPRRPVAALALPALTTTARSASSRQRSRHSWTGGAGVEERVKRAALTVSGASETSSPRSGPPDGLMPAGAPAARKPARGRPAAR